MSLGLSWAKHGKLSFETVSAVDQWDKACQTFQANLQIAPRVDQVSNRLVEKILRDVGGVDIVVGGPPCQGFSTSGKRALSDKRNQLVKSFLDAVDVAAPRVFIMENVTGFASFQNGRLISEVLDRASDLGFRVHTGILLASRFGVPQRRRRLFLVGIRNGNFEFPNSFELDKVSNSPLEIDQRDEAGIQAITFSEATSDLPRLNAGESRRYYAHKPRTAYQKWVRGACLELNDHIAARHSQRLIELMTHIPEGRSAFDSEVFSQIPRRLRPQSGFANSYSRIRASRPAPTITRNFTTPSSANCIHPSQNRAISLREGARCQSFPDSFVFAGNLSEKRLQIGNAVPPLLAQALGESVLRSL